VAAALATVKGGAARHAAALAPPFSAFALSPSSPNPSLASVRSRERSGHGGQWRGCGRRRHWPPRRRARSPEGERAAVERLSDGASGPVPHADERWRSDERSTRPVHPHSAHQGNAGGGDGSGKPQVGPFAAELLVLDLGLGLLFLCCLLFRFEIDVLFFYPSTVYSLD
jgi:hypothetical protein